MSPCWHWWRSEPSPSGTRSKNPNSSRFTIMGTIMTMIMLTIMGTRTNIMRVAVTPGKTEADIVFGPDGRARAFRLVKAPRQSY